VGQTLAVTRPSGFDSVSKLVTSIAASELLVMVKSGTACGLFDQTHFLQQNGDPILQARRQRLRALQKTKPFTHSVQRLSFGLRASNHHS
jgi:hypothetical protein